MALGTQDFDKGIDFTGLAIATGADHNTLITNAAPYSDDGSNGKGLVVWTKDTALNTPNVPDAATNTKWKRYLWIRIPHSTATTHTPLVYAWNDDSGSVATYLKWSVVTADITALQTQVNTVQATANAAKTSAAGASATANAAALTANSAVLSANTAETDATNAASNAATAAANAAAASAQVTALADNSNRYCKFSESYAANAAVTNITALSPYTRILNTTDFNPATPLFSLDVVTGKLTCLVAGKYKVDAIVEVANVGDFLDHKAVLVKDDNVIITTLIGTSAYAGAANNSVLYSHVKGIITLVINDVIKLRSYFSGGGAANSVTNGHQVAVGEVFTVIELQKLDS